MRGDTSRRRRSGRGPAARGWSANGRPVSRAIAACAADRTGGLRGGRGRRERQERHGRGIADRPQRGGRVGRQARVRALQHGGQRRDGRGLQPADVPDQEVMILARQPRPPQRLDQGRHRVGPRLPEAADGIVLLLGRLRQVGDEPRDPVGPGRVPTRGRRQGSLSGRANGRVAGSSSSRRNEPAPNRSRTATSVASSGWLFWNLSRYGTAFCGLAGADQVVGGLPELDRSPRLPGEQLGAGACAIAGEVRCSAAARACDQRLGERPGRRMLVEPLQRSRAELIPDRDQRRVVRTVLEELIQVGRALWAWPVRIR